MKQQQTSDVMYVVQSLKQRMILVTHIVTHHQQLQLTNSDNTATNTSDAPTKSISVRCLFCGKTFPNDFDLTNHIEEVHYQSNLLQSTDINILPQQQPQLHSWDLSHHYQENHSFHQPRAHGIFAPELHCNLCEFTSQNMVLLNIHLKEHRRIEH